MILAAYNKKPITRSPGSPLQCGQLAGSSLESSFKFVRDAVSFAELHNLLFVPSVTSQTKLTKLALL